MTQDKFYGEGVTLSDPANEAYPANTHVSQPLTNGPPRFIYVGTPGTLIVKLPDSPDDLTYLNASGFMPIRPSHIRAASTAAGIIVHY